MLRTTTLWMMISFIQACSSAPDATPAKSDRPSATPSPPQKTVFDPLTQGALGRARGVQDTVDQSAERTRRAVDNQEKGDSAP